MAPAWRTVGTGEGPFTGSAFVTRAVAVEDVAFYLCACVSGLHILSILRGFPKHAITGDVCVGGVFVLDAVRATILYDWNKVYFQSTASTFKNDKPKYVRLRTRDSQVGMHANHSAKWIAPC